MVEHRKEEGQVAGFGPFLVQRQDEAFAVGIDQIVAVLYPFRDPLGGAERTMIVARQEIGQRLRGDLGVDRHALVAQAATSRPRGSLNATVSRVVSTSRSTIW